MTETDGTTGLISPPPEKVAVIRIYPAVIFPHSTFKLVVGEETDQKTIAETDIAYAIVLPLKDDGTDFHVGTLGGFSDVKRIPEAIEMSFCGIMRVNVGGRRTTFMKWERRADVFSEESARQDPAFWMNVKILREEFLRYRALLGAVVTEEELKRTFAVPAAQEALKLMASPDEKSVGFAVDAVMNFLNAKKLPDMDEVIHEVSLMALKEEVVESRIIQATALLDTLNSHLADIAENTTGSRPTNKGQRAKAGSRAAKGGGRPTSEDPHESYRRKKSKMPEEAQKIVERELAQLEYKGLEVEAHLGWILAMPWGEYTQDTEDFGEVRKILDEDHWGLEKVKKRVLEFLAVRSLNPSAKSPILCLVGPPGVGKTSLGKSVARALGRKFVRLSLGGIRDERQIRGFEQTYYNALPGQIVQKLREAGSINPIFMLDEVDKVGRDSHHGDPASALLEVLDPEQNFAFRDHYLNVPLDLSRILFIATANILSTMLPALQDRMETIELPGYTPLEKIQIAKRYLISKQKRENGFPVALKVREGSVDLDFTDGALERIVYEYTDEAGVRQLERTVGAVFRKVALDLKTGKSPRADSVKVTEKNLHIFCGRPKYREHKYAGALPPGVVPVLAVTDTGGHVFYAEVSIGYHPGGRKIIISGVRRTEDNKESVNKIEESFKTAWDALAAKDRILFGKIVEAEKNLGPLLVSGRITNGDVPKDGPSAGVSLFIALYGALTEQSIRPDGENPLLAATGEINQRLDFVNAIGGVRDKLLAAHRHGIRKVIIPKDNERDLEDVPREILDEMEVKPLSSMLEALEYAYPNDQLVKEHLDKTRSSG